jgi:hypothetical protein
MLQTRAEHVDVGAALHRSLQHLQMVDLSFGFIGLPRIPQRDHYGIDIGDLIAGEPW